ncbi:hypothetical protein ACFMBG_21075 [Leisingera sp. D0M16]|uniref:hypothetical protein n=1 Tax=Leisingera coralii TaxID=3351347 RepID=UPI003B7BE520
MPAKLVFHTGSFKSGSTAIQSALAHKACKCSSLKIFYPGLGPKEGAEKRRGQHGPLADTLHPGQEAHGQRHARFSRVAAHIEAAGADVNVISAEKFEYVDPRALEQAVNEFLPGYRDALQIVFYVRPHAERLLSDYAERVKHGNFGGSLEDLHAHTKALSQLRQRSYFYHPRLMEWRAVFGERFTVRPMIRSQLFQADAVADFFNVILDGAPFELSTPPQSNRSPSLEDLAVVKAFHQSASARALPPRQRERTGVVLIRSLTALNSLPGTRLALHRSLAEDAARTYRADAEALDRDFFGGPLMQEALERAVDTAAAEPQPAEPAQVLDAAQMRQVSAWAETLAEILPRAS